MDVNKDELVRVVQSAMPGWEFLAEPKGFGWASDADTDVLGQLNRVYGRHPERAPVGKFDGDVGFIVEQ